MEKLALLNKLKIYDKNINIKPHINHLLLFIIS
jgi:hypothetical protein